jgi:hypothetical protein
MRAGENRDVEGGVGGEYSWKDLKPCVDGCFSVSNMIRYELFLRKQAHGKGKT